MRNYIYKIFISAILICFTACEVEEGGDSNRKTIQGMIAFETTNGFITDGISILEIMARVNYYGEADEDLKEGIRNYYLDEYKVTSVENVWTLKSNGAEFIFTHNGKSINEAGAVWTARIIFKDSYQEKEVVNGNFRVETVGEKEWMLKSTDMINLNSWDYSNENEKHTNELYIKGNNADIKSSNLYDYVVESGNGKITGNPVFTYKVTSPLFYYESLFYYISPISIGLRGGELDINADDKDKITAEVYIENSLPNYKITFNGITEDWNSYYW
ncbi:hypothetical protein D0T84_20040 [Dysgonomonas sp. 521]|uniref:hypothetical protein n=1 Tax=Dysgonomonas sp. 521 TaxID=2302932 RepID=UPI0013D68F40|nr:hypothetical protein [Dysgonomonas sp. 521]NDV97174.1 hypothetical protein [Dysgonomonas sp. 521]